MEIQFRKTNLQNAYFFAYFHECFFGVFRVLFHSLRHEKNLTANSFEIHLHFDAFIQSRNKNSKTNWTNRNRNHLILFNLFHQFQQSKGRSILIHPYQGRDVRMIQKIRKSYRNDIREFLDFLYSTKGHFDNTVSMHTKNLNSYLKWLEKRLGIDIIKYCEDYMVPSHPIPVVVLSEERLSFLMYNIDFQASLCPRLQFAKDLLVFGCITGLRVSDLLNLRKTSLEKFDGQLYLRVTASKTEIESRICLPPIAVDILERNNQKRKSKIFRPIGASNLNAYMNLEYVSENLFRPKITVKSVVPAFPSLPIILPLCLAHEMPDFFVLLSLMTKF